GVYRVSRETRRESLAVSKRSWLSFRRRGHEPGCGAQPYHFGSRGEPGIARHVVDPEPQAMDSHRPRRIDYGFLHSRGAGPGQSHFAPGVGLSDFDLNAESEHVAR